jgi:hypothetical protein
LPGTGNVLAMGAGEPACILVASALLLKIIAKNYLKEK